IGHLPDEPWTRLVGYVRRKVIGEYSYSDVRSAGVVASGRWGWWGDAPFAIAADEANFVVRVARCDSFNPNGARPGACRPGTLRDAISEIFVSAAIGVLPDAHLVGAQFNGEGNEAAVHPRLQVDLHG